MLEVSNFASYTEWIPVAVLEGYDPRLQTLEFLML